MNNRSAVWLVMTELATEWLEDERALRRALRFITAARFRPPFGRLTFLTGADPPGVVGPAAYQGPLRGVSGTDRYPRFFKDSYLCWVRTHDGTVVGYPIDKIPYPPPGSPRGRHRKAPL